MQSLPGTYTLVLNSSIEKAVVIGQLGTLFLSPGFYVYVGSAFGPGGIKARINHHVTISSRPHWHIDYLGPTLTLCEIWYTYDQARREHQWAKVHLQTKRALLPLPGFGSSDCRCPAHLFFYKSKPSGTYFRRKIRTRIDGHAKLMILESKKILDNTPASDIH